MINVSPLALLSWGNKCLIIKAAISTIKITLAKTTRCLDFMYIVLICGISYWSGGYTFYQGISGQIRSICRISAIQKLPYISEYAYVADEHHIHICYFNNNFSNFCIDFCLCSFKKNNNSVYVWSKFDEEINELKTKRKTKQDNLF